MRQITLRFALLIALMVIAIGPVQAQEEGQVVVPAGEKIKIAVEVDLTNVLPESGLDVWQGVQVAAAFINEAGGVKGFEIEVFVEDDRCSGDDATTVASRVAADPQVVGVVGAMCSGATIAASDVYEDARIVMVSPSATAVEVTARGLDVINRVAPLDSNQGIYDAHYMYKVLGARKLAAMHDNDTYGLGLAQAVADEFEALGGEVVAFEGINVDDQDYRPVLTPIAALEPDVIFFGGYTQQAVLLAPQKNDVGMEDVIFFGADGIKDEAFVAGAGEAGEGTYASFTPQLEYEDFDTRFFEMFDVTEYIGQYHYHGSDALNMIVQGIDAASEVDADGNLVIDREALIEAVRSTEEFEGLTGTLTCAEIGDCGSSIFTIFTVEDGGWTPIEVPEDLLETGEEGGDTGAALDGEALVNERCTVCHSRERIDAADKDEAGWTETVDRMIGNGAVLDTDERQAVLDYLVATH
jgi:branched-chain amino acid transport system substrate-binding protein